MTATIWVIDDDRSIRWVLEKALSQEGYQLACFEDADEALNRLDEGGPEPDVLISDVRMPGTDGLRMLKILQRNNPNLPVIIMTAHSDLDSAVASYQGGAFEYLPKPFDVDEAVALVKRAIKHRQEAEEEVAAPAQETPTEIIGEAPAMQEVFRAIGRLSHSNVTVLINGQSGTGKELVARALHNHSMRREKPFVALNMAAIPKDLIESELFGHEKGAFTGANSQRVGRFEQSNGGTLFLDEIGDASDEVQVALLRTLETSEVRPVGSSDVLKVDVRLVAATDADLESKLESQDFRNPLLQRLTGFEIWIPRLAQRKPDIGLLLSEFLRFEFDAIAEQRHYQELDPTSEMLWYQFFRHALAFHWPGNIRQMRNVARQVAIHNRLASFTSIPPRVEAMLLEENQRAAEEAATGHQFESENTPAPGSVIHHYAHEQNDDPNPAPQRRKPSTIEETELMEALERQRWDLKNTAEDLNISRAALYKMIEANPNVRKAGDISVEELTHCYEQCSGDLEMMVSQLQVSKAALKRRIKELAIG